MEVLTLTNFVSESNTCQDVISLLKQIRSIWNFNSISIKEVVGGTSNYLYVAHSDDADDSVLVRIYGKSLLYRDNELTFMSILSSHGLSAKVFARFNNGFCYQYIHGSVLDVEDLKDVKIQSMIAQEMAKLHSVEFNDFDRKPVIFALIKQFANALPDNLDDLSKNQRYKDCYPTKSEVLQEIDDLEKHLTLLGSPVALCHNDLNVRNVILSNNKDRIHFIDFEFADFNYCAFDIACHFVEFAGLENPDFSRYPDRQTQLSWIKTYLENRVNNGNISNDNVTDEDCNNWYKMVNKFSLVSHLHWSVWSIWQEQSCTIKFNYLDYGIARWNEYKSHKSEFMGL